MAKKNVKHQTSNIKHQTSAYLHALQNPLGRKGWTIVWDKDEEIKKDKKSAEKTFNTKLPKRRIVTVHLNGTMRCAVNPKNANSGIQYKIWINDDTKLAWGETKSGNVSHTINKSISLIIPKGGDMYLSFRIEALHAAVSEGKETPLVIEKGFSIVVSKISYIDQTLSK